MNWLAALSAALKIIPGIVTFVQTLHGDQVAGDTKKQIAQDLLGVATGTADSVLTGNSQDTALANVFSAVTSTAIDQTVALQKAAGTYQQATAIANAALTGTVVAAAATQAVQSIESTAAPAAAPAPATPPAPAVAAATPLT